MTGTVGEPAMSSARAGEIKVSAASGVDDELIAAFNPSTEAQQPGREPVIRGSPAGRVARRRRP